MNLNLKKLQINAVAAVAGLAMLSHAPAASLALTDVGSGRTMAPRQVS